MVVMEDPHARTLRFASRSRREKQVSDTTELYTAQVIYIQNKLIKLLTLIEQERLGEATFIVDGLIQYVDSFIEEGE